MNIFIVIYLFILSRENWIRFRKPFVRQDEEKSLENFIHFHSIELRKMQSMMMLRKNKKQNTINMLQVLNK